MMKKKDVKQGTRKTKKPGPGRPSTGREETRQAALLIPVSVSDWLDEVTLGTKRNATEAISRSMVVRAILRGIMKSKIRFDGCQTEEEIVDYLQKRIHSK